jgi:hypothetical protein
MYTERASEAPVGLSVFTNITVSAMQIDTGVRILVTSWPSSSRMLRCTSRERVPILMVAAQIPELIIKSS